LIPNSVFLEQRVTNWTLSSRRVLRSVSVGVAYGSPTRVVTDLLTECAERHGLVLADPSPFVRFENFGDNALEFTLYYWIEVQESDTGRMVSSDLRYMIDKSFGEHGVVIAYPQRDVRLDAAAPLKVELVAPPPAADPIGG
jgi:small-conductance mechanosensitive channel